MGLFFCTRQGSALAPLRASAKSAKSPSLAVSPLIPKVVQSDGPGLILIQDRLDIRTHRRRTYEHSRHLCPLETKGWDRRPMYRPLDRRPRDRIHVTFSTQVQGIMGGERHACKQRAVGRSFPSAPAEVLRSFERGTVASRNRQTPSDCIGNISDIKYTVSALRSGIQEYAACPFPSRTPLNCTLPPLTIVVWVFVWVWVYWCGWVWVPVRVWVAFVCLVGVRVSWVGCAVCMLWWEGEWCGLRGVMVVGQRSGGVGGWAGWGGKGQGANGPMERDTGYKLVCVTI